MSQLRFAIVGTPRSGTTLVQALANGLPGVVVPPETHFLSLFAEGMSERHRFPIGEQQLREEVRAFATLPTSAGLEIDADGIVERLDRTARGPIAVYRAVVESLDPSAEVLGEKTPDHLLWWRPLTAHDPLLRLVWVLRDPRAVTASSRGLPFGMDRDALIAERWRQDQRQLARARRALGPDRLLVLRYEEVVQEPDAAQRALADLLELSMLGPAPGPTGVGTHHPWEHWKARTLERPTTARIRAWETAMTHREVAGVEAICSPGMRALGYEPVTSASDRARASLLEPPGDRLRRLRLRRARRARARGIEGVRA